MGVLDITSWDTEDTQKTGLPPMVLATCPRTGKREAFVSYKGLSVAQVLDSENKDEQKLRPYLAQFFFFLRVLDLKIGFIPLNGHRKSTPKTKTFHDILNIKGNAQFAHIDYI